MRLPAPAAGMIPHIDKLDALARSARPAGGFPTLAPDARPCVRRARAPAPGGRSASALLSEAPARAMLSARSARPEFRARREELLDALPTSRSGSARRRPPPRRAAPRDSNPSPPSPARVTFSVSREEEKNAGCAAGGTCWKKKMFGDHGKILRVVRAADHKTLLRHPPRRLDKELSSAACRSSA